MSGIIDNNGDTIDYHNEIAKMKMEIRQIKKQIIDQKG